MSIFKIQGGVQLTGTVRVSGAKNEALKLIAFAVLLKNPVVIKNIPKIVDIERQLEIFEDLGGKVIEKDGGLELDARDIEKFDISSCNAKKLRASLVYLGPLLSRFSQAIILQPGGCQIGERSIETHLDVFRQLGATITENKEKIILKLNEPKRNKVVLREQSVTATENIAMYAAAQEGEITIENCATEPEISALLGEMVKSGARISGIGTRTLIIKGSKNLNLDTIEVIVDRIEAATFAIAFAATAGEGTITPFPSDDLESFIDVLKKCNVEIKINGDSARILKSGDLKPFSISTAPYPGFPTDLQPPMALLASRANGTSYINETMYENRLGYLKELQKMGLSVTFQGTHKASITGPVKLHPTTIHSLDLRSGITLLIAALMTDGLTTIKDAEIIDRGYENIEDKLAHLGAKIKRTS